MINQNIHNHQLYYRLIALWVVCEAFAGGLLHAARIPFTGMVVSSLAVFCIIVIAWYVPVRMAIFRATLLVAIFKLMLSPHSPPTAYIAVFFQGLGGQLLLSNKKYFKIASVLFAILALVETALQRLLVLVLLYGIEFWQAVDKFIQKILGEAQPTNFSIILATIYIITHAVCGLLVGLYAAKAAIKAPSWYQPDMLIKEFGAAPEQTVPLIKRKKKIKIIFLISWVLLCLLFLQAFFYPSSAVLPSGEILRIILRSVLIILTWYLLISPLLMRYLKTVLYRRRSKMQPAINQVIDLLPHIKYIFIQSWKISVKHKGFSRISIFLKILLVNILNETSIK